MNGIYFKKFLSRFLSKELGTCLQLFATHYINNKIQQTIKQKTEQNKKVDLPVLTALSMVTIFVGSGTHPGLGTLPPLSATSSPLSSFNGGVVKLALGLAPAQDRCLGLQNTYFEENSFWPPYNINNNNLTFALIFQSLFYHQINAFFYFTFLVKSL